MKYYKKIITDDTIIFKNFKDGTELLVKHYNDDYTFDAIYLKNKYECKFVDYFVNELKKTNDVKNIISLYDDIELEEFLQSKGFKILNYEYLLKNDRYETDIYEIEDKLDENAEKYYLDSLNELQRINSKYYNPNYEPKDFDENWFNNTEFNYRVYKQNGEIVGIIDFKKPIENNKNEEKLNHNDKVYVRYIFAKNSKVTEDILKDLSNKIKKDLIVTIVYMDKSLRETVKNLDCVFKSCSFTIYK